ncbi:MAG: Ig-like domain-containing protein [Vicinamibacteria bacterium]
MVLSGLRHAYLLWLLGFSGLAACGPGKPRPPALRFESDPASEDFGTVLATGGSAASSFSVRVEGADPEAPSVAGSYVSEDEGVRFRPRFPFTAGLSYRSRFEDVELVFTMPEPDPGEPPRVEAIYPSNAEVPENLLRLYVHFSRPMRAKDVHRHVHLYDADGGEVPLPFVEVETGLWDTEGRRLTLFFHPGRIKRGVGPNAALGPPLRAGSTYRLVVDREMKDARGYELESAFERELRVGPPDRSSPDPSRWKLIPPGEASSALHVAFDEPLDRALLLRWLRIETGSGDAVSGTSSADVEEGGFTFTPDEPWPVGSYRLVVHPEIEDLAGNTPGRLFDVEAGSSREGPSPIELAFAVR